MTTNIEIEDRRRAGCTVARVHGDIDLATLPVFRCWLDRLRCLPASTVVVDLGEVGHLSARGVGELLALRTALEREGRTLHLFCEEHRPARIPLAALGVPAISHLPHQ